MNETILGINFGLGRLIGLMVKILMVLITLLSLIIIRQVSLMDKVVTFQLGGKVKLAALIFFLVCFLITGITILVS